MTLPTTRPARLLIPVLITTFVACSLFEPDEKTCPPSYRKSGDDCILDTTSHDFTWETDVLAQAGYIYGVFALSPTDVWVVGDFQDYDPPSLRINAAHWDGTSWERRAAEPKPVANDVIAFAPDDVWMAAGIPMHWDGSNWNNYHLWEMGVLSVTDGGTISVWGTSSSDLYFAGRLGTFVHYDGETFTIIPTNTDMRLQSMAGTTKGNVWITGDLSAVRSKLFSFRKGTWSTVWDVDHPFFDFQDEYGYDYVSVEALFVVNDDYLVLNVAGRDQMISIHRLDNFSNFDTLSSPETSWLKAADGNDINDFFFVGQNDAMFHYNGASFKTFEFGSNPLSVWWQDVDQIGDYVFVVGSTDQGPTVLRGIRN
ncbi:hypothetical protein ACFL6E_03400 [Candidatus Neomarinimicrobiota bacterium]